jgi:peptidoglycan/xylan/chitin deacetylase (PgdA/CDA1 family)
MLVVKRKCVAGLLIAALLWAACGIGLLGMWNSRAAMAGIAPIMRGHSGFSNVSLMFNVDWGEEHLAAILDILKEKGAHVTFFPTGSWAEKNPGILTRMVVEGHEVGNHGAVHSHVETMSKENLQRLIRSGEERIFLACGARPSRLFAPPYGEWNDQTVAYAVEMGYHTVLWTVDTMDWRLPPPEAVWKRALAGAVPGALILLHPTEPTASALPLIIDGLREKGYTLTTVSDVVAGGSR